MACYLLNLILIKLEVSCSHFNRPFILLFLYPINKYLSIWHLSFKWLHMEQHIEYIKEKAWNRINVLQKLKFQLDRQSLETIYLTFIQPVLGYSDVALDNCMHNEKEELKKIQNEAVRLVTQALPNWFLYSLFMQKLVGTRLTRDVESTN